MPFLDIVEYEVDVDEVSFQTQSAHKHECLVYPFRSAAEDAVEQQNTGYCERDIEHSFQEEREMTMLHLLQEMLERSVIRNMIQIIQMLAPSSVSLRRTISPMLIPMKNIGTRLQKISR